MNKNYRRLFILLYVEAHPGTIAARIAEAVYPLAVRGENSIRRGAYLDIRDMEEQGFLRRVGSCLYVND